MQAGLDNCVVPLCWCNTVRFLRKLWNDGEPAYASLVDHLRKGAALAALHRVKQQDLIRCRCMCQLYGLLAVSAC